MTLRQLELFALIYELRNLTRAAESLYMTQSAATQNLKKMEEELGVRLFERDMTREKVAILHNDYHLLNAYIVSRYHIRDELVWPEGFESEPVNRIYPFLLRDFLSEMRGDFTEHPEGKTVYMTEALLEEYLSDTRGVCRDALRRILTGGEPLDPMSLTW